MAAAVTLVLKDRNAVNVNYAPKVIRTGELAEYVDRTQGVISLQPTAKLEQNESSKDTRRTTITTVYPVLHSDGTIKYNTITTKFSMDKNLALTTFQEAEARHRAYIIDTRVTAAVENGETDW